MGLYASLGGGYSRSRVVVVVLGVEQRCCWAMLAERAMMSLCGGKISLRYVIVCCKCSNCYVRARKTSDSTQNGRKLFFYGPIAHRTDENLNLSARLRKTIFVPLGSIWPPRPQRIRFPLIPIRGRFFGDVRVRLRAPILLAPVSVLSDNKLNNT